MRSKLEKFIVDNREEFDSEQPSGQLWNRINGEMNPGSKGKVVRMRKFWWSAAAAAVVILLGVGSYYLGSLNNNVNTGIAKVEPNQGISPETEAIMKEINPGYAKEVYHFTQLIELKQNELEKIRKEEPELYNKFLGDITKLDSSYNALQKQLPENPNREQLLEAMIQNLRLQTELLNQQLLIIQQIKKSKSNSDENNSKSI